MTPPYKDARRLAQSFKALADETRLQMLLLLADHEELCVCDFEHILDITQSKASRHLRYLYHAGMVDERREGVWIFYRLAGDAEPLLRTVLETARTALDPQALLNLDEQTRRWCCTRVCRPEDPHLAR